MGEPLASTAVAVDVHVSEEAGSRAARGQSSTSVQPAGAVTGTPPMLVERAGSGSRPAGVAPSGRWMLPTAANATASVTTPATTPPNAVRT